VGVVQLRARTQLMSYRPELDWELITGDVSAWLTALIDGSVDALVAPGAAIEHLALQERVCEIFPPELLVPAPGSGVLLCLCREDDDATCARLNCLHDPPTAAEYEAECAFMDSLEGRWEHPIGALAQCLGDEIAITAVVSSADGTNLLRENHIASADDPTEVGCELAALMIQAGAEKLLHRESEEATGDAVNRLAGLLTARIDDELEEAQWDLEPNLGETPGHKGDEDEEEDW
jgi:hydroxymethylbilane synthase